MDVQKYSPLPRQQRGASQCSPVVTLDQALEAVLFNELDLAEIHRRGIRSGVKAGEERGPSQHIAVPGNLQNHGLSVANDSWRSEQTI